MSIRWYRVDKIFVRYKNLGKMHISNGVFFLAFFCITFLAGVTDCAVAKNSAPFDPFRLECPFYHGIIKLELQRVESSEGVRTDTMITSFCENVKKLYPSPRDSLVVPQDETCRWTNIFKIPGKDLDFTSTCSGKEFVSGISRQALGEYSILCCKLRDRKKGSCTTADFAWPSLSDPQSDIERGKQLLVAVGFKKGRLVGQFCEFEIMSKQELDAEFIAAAQARLISQIEEDKLKNTNITKASLQGAGRAKPAIKPAASRPASNDLPPGILPPGGRASFASPRPTQKPTTLPPEDTEDIEDNDEGAGEEGEETATPKPPSPPAKVQPARPIASAKKGFVQPATEAPEVDEEEYEEEEVTEETEPPTPASPPGRPLITTLKAPVLKTEAIDADFSEEYEDETTTTKQKVTSTTTTTPRTTVTTTKPTTRKPTTTTVIVTTTEEEEDVSVPSATQPNPAHFQVLGIPRPAASKPLRPSALFIKPPGLPVPGKPDGEAGFSTEALEETQSTPLPPAPPAPKNAPSIAPSAPTTSQGTEIASESTVPTTDRTDSTSGTRSPTKPSKGAKPKSKSKEKENNGGTFPTPPSPVGQLGSDSSGVVISPRNDTVNSAFVPLKPFLTVPQRSTTTTVATTESVSTVAGRSDADSSTTTTVPISTTTEEKRVECETSGASRDPISNLVVACGQGQDIWSPPRCPANTFCLLAKDSNFRVCCAVQVG